MAYRKLGRDNKHRRAMLANLTKAVIMNESIETTETRAKEVRKFVDKMITYGKKGDLVGLEVNMRAPGGCIIDMINYAYDIDVFTIWADMLIYNKCFYDVNRKYLVGYVSRRNNTDYLHSMKEVYEKYGDKIMANMDIPPIFSDAMGDNVLLFRTKSKNEIFEIISFILKHRSESNWFDKYTNL
mgnify:CR=1 FL=1